ncbi:DNA repair protein RecO [Seonamhaeicola maritimus]|uniref:DNA repair protein RecO n=1 Tax=Seonamhaeicola maritimus TaxID=2591822 RepID=A0A5C7GGZ6_9FLAO|nr:DNA repair protein RecO [Seonamhaeicola maritimus]TXG37020.1 DNA repair protein RecO [Seonamhaeicola maritimus]
MLITTKAIVLSKIKYKDYDLIVKCYTEQLGVVSFILKGVLKSKKGSSKVAYFQLLSQLQLIIQYKENRSLQSIKETKLSGVYTSLHSNIIKGSIVMFLAEVLSNVLKEEEQNETLFSYIETTLLWLDAHSSYSNFHLLFLLNLTKYLGFYPDPTQIEQPFFNLYEGKFEIKKTDKYSVSGDNLMLLKQLLGTTFDALSLVKISSKQRQSFLNMILVYFELHLGSFKRPKSLQIFNQVFN